MKPQKGVVLFTVIMMLAVLSMLVLSLMQQVLLYVKATNQLTRRHQQFYQLESAAHELQSTLFTALQAQCSVHQKSPSDLIVLQRQHHGCERVLDDRRYTYLIDDLGLYPCLRIEEKNELWSSHHWLISVSSQNPSFEWIQIRVTTPTPLSPCGETEKLIPHGVLSWAHGT